MAEDRTPASTLVTAGGAPLDLRTIHHPDLTNFPEYSPSVRRGALSQKSRTDGEEKYVDFDELKISKAFLRLIDRHLYLRWMSRRTASV